MFKKPADDSKYKYARSDLMEKCNDGVNRLEKEKQRENVRTILGCKEYDIMNVTEKNNTRFNKECI